MSELSQNPADRKIAYNGAENWPPDFKRIVAFRHLLPARRLPMIAALAGMLLGGCAVGPNFHRPAAPTVSDYTEHPLVTTVTTTNIAGGEAQRFATGGDLAGDWWTLFHSAPLNELIELALTNNPDLKAAQAALTVARENVLAQRGVYYPSVGASFSASRQKQSEMISPTPNAGIFQYNLFTPQVSVSYSPDVFGLNRRTVESVKAQEQNVRFQMIAAYTTLTANVVVTAIQSAAVQAQIDATRQLVDLNSNMVEILRYQYTKGYAGRLDVVAQESQLAQINATLPPLFKQAAQLRDLLAVLAGRFPNQSPMEKFELSSLQLPVEIPGEPAVATRGAAARCFAGRGEPARRERADRHRHREPAAEHHAHRRCRQHGVVARQSVFVRHRLLGFGRRGYRTTFSRRTTVASGARGEGGVHAGGGTISQHGAGRVSKCGGHVGRAGTGRRGFEGRRHRGR